MTKPMVSVCTITYGHEKYIRQAVQGVLMQKVDFSVEFIIADDCSPDETESVVHDCYNNYPNGIWIKYTKHERNKGINANLIWALEQCKGKYIALLEGDDYWTDPLKLQKQVDFLEANEKYVMSFHDVFEVDENSNSMIRQVEKQIERKTYSRKEMLLGRIMPTASNVIRGDELRSLLYLPKIEEVFNLDTFIHAQLSRYGGAYYHEKMTAAAYRVHPGGVWSGADSKFKGQEALKTILAIYDTIEDNDSEKILKKTILKHYLQIVKFKAKRLEIAGAFLNVIKLLKFLVS